MSRVLTSVVVSCLVLAVAVSAGAGIPDAFTSYITMTAGGKGLVTCPAGDGGAYGYVTVTALRTDLSPIQGIDASNFFFTIVGVGGGNVSLTAVDAETDVNGEIRFEADSSGTVVYGSLTVSVQIYTVAVASTGVLWCNTFDYDNNGLVNPVDFANFAGDFGGANERSDFDWNGVVNPVDFAIFAAHFGHS